MGRLWPFRRARKRIPSEPDNLINARTRTFRQAGSDLRRRPRHTQHNVVTVLAGLLRRAVGFVAFEQEIVVAGAVDLDIALLGHI